ncbi:MAG: hypothetical protein Q4E51_09860 [Lachnospiraceae bacterium]|nr:hypothetical protein [Lachnospiraceae bacterium]
MSLNLEETLKKIKIAYSSFYNVETTDKYNEDSNTVEEGNIMNALFHMHSENYVISKKAQLYQMDTNEYIYFFYYDHLSKSLFDEAVAFSYENGFPQIKPDKDHRSSYIGTVIICNSYDEDALIALKKYRKRQSFKFSLYGWMEVHTALVDLRSESVWHNSDGSNSGKFLKGILHPKRRKKFIFF